MPLLFVLVILAVLAVVAVVASGRLGPEGGLPEPVVDRAPLGLPEGPLTPGALSELRFSVGLRGYRMDQVDEVLDRCGQELAARDAHIARLERSLEQRAALVPEGQAPSAPPEPA